MGSWCEWDRFCPYEESTMSWETPVAIDLRLGMEITMYAEHR
jgi:coenzyme PQQ precursor peptide PqqA